MDSERFDAWTQALVDGRSRRRVLKWLSVGAVGAAFAGLGAGRAKADAPCAQLCREARARALEVCAAAGGRTLRSFACPPTVGPDGRCNFSLACARGGS